MQPKPVQGSVRTPRGSKFSADQQVLLHELEDLGWVTRKVHSGNRSSNLVHITARGRKKLRAAGARFQERIRGALEGLPARDLAHLEHGAAALATMWMEGVRERRNSAGATR
jgi:DNA-binding PadR family transcriptional regulator